MPTLWRGLAPSPNQIKAMPPVKNPNFWKVEEKGRKEIGKGITGISMEKEECREPPKRAPKPVRVLNLSGKLGFLIRGITFTLISFGSGGVDKEASAAAKKVSRE